ncbi:MAG: PKD domain-containing protein [Methanoregula sp.]|nr:PKD domain-containing protein [Methanoregula sp.]
MKNYISVVCVIVMLCLLIGFGQALMIPQSDTELIRASDEIVYGEIVSVSSQWNAQKTHIETTAQILVADAFKNDTGVRSGSTVPVTIRGGTVDDVTEWVEDMPVFVPDTDVFIYLNKKSDGEYSVCGLYQGVHTVNSNKLGKPQTTKSSSSVSDVEKIKENIRKTLQGTSTDTASGIFDTSSDSLDVSGPVVYSTTVTTVSPNTASAGTDTVITITGSGFGTKASRTSTADVGFLYRPDGTSQNIYATGYPYFTQNVNDIVSWSDTQIKVKVPTGICGDQYSGSASSGYFYVYTDAGARSTAIPFTVTFAYGKKKWITPATYYVNPGTVSGAATAIQSASLTWNNAIPGSSFRLNYGGPSTSTTFGRDGTSLIYFGPESDFISNPNVIAWASSWTTAGNITEADIEFNTHWTWTTGTASGNSMNIEAIVLHEQGHWLFLKDLYGDVAGYPSDLNPEKKVMFGINGDSLGNKNLKTLSAADIAGIRWIYPGTISATNSTLRGFVFDSVTGLNVPGANLSIAGLSTISGSDGNYTITGIPPGVLNVDFTGSPRNGLSPLTVSFNDLSVTNTNILTVTKTGYYTFTNNGISIEPGQTLQYDVPITPELSPGGEKYRIVLTWDENPRDLDSHLVTPMIEGHTDHIYYWNKGSLTSWPYAQLDRDDVTSYGPETITINRTFSGTYNYYVYHYAGTGSLSTSNAQVLLYSGSALVATYRVPTTGTGLYWQVFNLDGATGAITSISTIANAPQNSSSRAYSLDPATYPEKPVETPVRQFICPPGLGFSEELLTVKSLSVNPNLSWSWNFGDGTSIVTTQNPNHTYSNPGSYTVIHTVTNLNGTRTETKANYITVTSTRPIASKVGIYRSGNFFLASSNSNGGGTVNAFNFGQSGDVAVIGDWSGSTTPKVGIFRNGAFYLASSNTLGGGTVNAFGYGQAGDVPVAGDWDGDGIDTVGIFRNGAFYLASSNTLGGGRVNAFGYGQAGDMPVVGDWNEDGATEVGIYRTDPYRGAFYLASSNTPGGGTVNAFTYGMLGDVPVAGKWT